MQRIEKIYIYIFLSLNFLQWISIVEIEYGLPQFIKYIFSLAALSGMIYYRYYNPVRNTESRLFEPLTLFFAAWSIFLLLQVAVNFNDVFYIQRVFGQRYFFLPYMLPLVILYTRFEVKYFAYILKHAAPLLILSVGVQIFVLGFHLGRDMYEPLHRVLLFDLGSSLLLLTAHLSDRKYVSYLTVAYFVLAIMLYASFGRRGLFLEAILLLFAMMLLRIKSSRSNVNDRMVLYLALIMMVMVVMVLFEPVLSSVFIFQRGFSQDALDASRGQVFADFFFDFRGWQDWIFGRGLDGHILRTIAEDETEQLIENGFLTILLKGGLLYLVPMVLIMFRACFLGFFRSNNDLSKALATIVIVQVVSMVLFGLPDYSTQYVLVWIAIGTCHSKIVRQMDNEELVSIINQ